jgi:hypothetical protein
MRNVVRAGVLLAAILAYGVVAYWAHAEADRAFDERMRRDRTELAERLTKAGATKEQVAAVVDYEAAVGHHVASLVRSTSSTGTATLLFLGVTLGAFVVATSLGGRPSRSSTGGDQGPPAPSSSGR